MRIDQLLSLSSQILPIIFFFAFRSSRDKRVLWVVFFYVIYSLYYDYHTGHLQHMGMTADPSYLLFKFLDFAFISTILFLLLSTRIAKLVLLIASALFLGAIAVFYFAGSDRFSAAVLPLEFIVALPFCIIYLFEQINRSAQGNLFDTPGFWIILGFFIFISGTLFLYIIRIFDAEEAQRWWPINNYCNALYNFSLAFAYLINYYNSRSKNPPRKRSLAESLEN